LRGLHGFFRRDCLRLDVGYLLRQRMAVLGNFVELLPVRRLGGNVGDLSIERRDLPRDFRDEILAFLQGFLKALEPRPGFRRAMRDVGEMRVGFDTPCLRLF
jgi:hypothetical protein